MGLIANGKVNMTKWESKILCDLYTDNDYPADRILCDDAALRGFAKAYRMRSNTNTDNETVRRMLLKLRKNGGLPKIGRSYSGPRFTAVEEPVGVGFIGHYTRMQKSVHRIAREKGWWPANPEMRSKGELVALIHSELSEALEGMRMGKVTPSDKIGDQGFSVEEEELADTIIRIMDMSEVFGYRVAEAIIAKAAYNRGRSHRHGGKTM